VSERKDTALRREARAFWDATRKAIYGSIPVGIVALGAAALAGMWSPVAVVWRNVYHLPDSFAEVNEGIARNRADIRALEVPRDVFQMSERRTRPADGPCIEAQVCRINTFLRRFARALDCQFVAGSVRLGFIDPQREEPIYALRVPPIGTPRQLTTAWEPISFSFITPTGLSPSAEFFIEADYTKCPGMDPEQSITARSNLVAVPISKL